MYTIGALHFNKGLVLEYRLQLHGGIGRGDFRVRLDQENELGARQEDGPVAVRRVHARRTIEIERIVPAETRGDAGALDLADRIHFRRQAIPAAYHDGSPSSAAQPASIDGARQREYVHRARRRL